VQDLTYCEIAEVTGVSIGAVMSRLARARRRLVAIVAKNMEPVTIDSKAPAQRTRPNKYHRNLIPDPEKNAGRPALFLNATRALG